VIAEIPPPKPANQFTAEEKDKILQDAKAAADLLVQKLQRLLELEGAQ
jgi:hypothetical protein